MYTALRVGTHLNGVVVPGVVLQRIGIRQVLHQREHGGFQLLQLVR